MRDMLPGSRRIGSLPDIREETPRAVWTQPRLSLSWGPNTYTYGSPSGLQTAPIINPVGPDPILAPPPPAGDGRQYGMWRPYTDEYLAVWETPWFDLRPDLRSIENQPKLGVPIWSRSARLYLELLADGGTTGFLPNNYRATMREYYDTINLDPGQINAAAPGRNFDPYASTLPVDISPILFPPGVAPTATTLGVFAPPGTSSGTGEGYPVRYWKVNIQFRFFSEPDDPLPRLNTQASYY